MRQLVDSSDLCMNIKTEMLSGIACRCMMQSQPNLLQSIHYIEKGPQLGTCRSSLQNSSSN